MREQIENLVEEMLNGQILLNEAMCEFEKIYIQKALERCDDHLSRTADTLGIHRNTLSKRVAAYQSVPKTPKRLISHRSK